jgi:hypothetical protein
VGSNPAGSTIGPWRNGSAPKNPMVANMFVIQIKLRVMREKKVA